MQFVSTQGKAPPVSLSAAISQGLAPDGGLYVPAAWPQAALDKLSPGASLAQIAAQVIAPFAADDVLASQTEAITAEAFNFPVPLVDLGENLSVLELFHGPTAAFKDFGARFLAGCMSRIRVGAARPLRILVATSGDTGGAVAAAFHNRPGVEVAVLYPKGLVSPAQEQQLTCWDGNVRAFEVRGTFDDCQLLVKAAFNDEKLRASGDLTSANSINLGRLLPQMTYYAMASASAFRVHGERLSFVIPSGNLGNATACVWARKIGFPIGEIVLAHNANCAMVNYLESGEWRPRQSAPTLASAMDVGNPSNAERLFSLWPGLEDLRAAVSAYAIDDNAIRARIKQGDVEHGQVWCPHTATAAEAFAQHKQRTGAPGHWAIVATAHPAKFPEIVEPIIGRAIALPPALAGLKERPVSKTEIEPDLSALVRELTRSRGGL
jgi:threonine synthase